ncbi:MAG: biopolymer transporter ExbD [Planctomycetaceae bacterium]|nr:biopolymer transporter ExbD [Planctomycetaceae bacterium]
MRRPTIYSQRTPLRFNITPLIDVVFLLIIFFLVASHFVRSEQAQQVSLPVATGGEVDNQQSPNRLTLTVEADGQLFLAGEPIAEDLLFERISQLETSDPAAPPEVRIRGDRDGEYGQMRRIIEYCASRRIQSIQFAVRNAGDAP